MKNIFAITLLAISSSAFSQVIIGDNVGTATNKTSVLLEFAKTENKGIVLPYITTIPTTPTEGTIILDATTPTSSAVKYYNGTQWIDLSSDNKADITTALEIQNTATENANAKTIIGGTTSSADGILVLESTSKAMVLPHVSSIADIPSPAPGMMVYINKDGAKRLAVYNGAKWTFWSK
ncbi:MAG: hypothetical protein Q4G16_01205 [Cruoricaptor ignavus]|nr:hypothetical protein [Cruoricaptor ignavus]MDO5614779.1 hypothetical protein [Cruoricaptor ignavus]